MYLTLGRAVWLVTHFIAWVSNWCLLAFSTWAATYGWSGLRRQFVIMAVAGGIGGFIYSSLLILMGSNALKEQKSRAHQSSNNGLVTFFKISAGGSTLMLLLYTTIAVLMIVESTAHRDGVHFVPFGTLLLACLCLVVSGIMIRKERARQREPAGGLAPYKEPSVEDVKAPYTQPDPTPTP